MAPSDVRRCHDRFTNRQFARWWAYTLSLARLDTYETYNSEATETLIIEEF